MISEVDNIGNELIHLASCRASPNSGAVPFFGSLFAPGFLLGESCMTSSLP